MMDVDEKLLGADLDEEARIEMASAMDEPGVGVRKLLQAFHARCRHVFPSLVFVLVSALVSRRSAQMRLAAPSHAWGWFPLLWQTR
jgi:hypothetical protein